jgi:hypothetical protein
MYRTEHEPARLDAARHTPKFPEGPCYKDGTPNHIETFQHLEEKVRECVSIRIGGYCTAI